MISVFFRGKKNKVPAGFVDLQQMVSDYGIQCAGLKKLVAIILGYRISKKTAGNRLGG